jgi:hypothetical protein
VGAVNQHSFCHLSVVTPRSWQLARANTGRYHAVAYKSPLAPVSIHLRYIPFYSCRLEFAGLAGTVGAAGTGLMFLQKSAVTKRNPTSIHFPQKPETVCLPEISEFSGNSSL